ncbi:MAG: PfkB family carbohydrate kinase, partial [Chthoniobacteraceae bacterium]
GAGDALAGALTVASVNGMALEEAVHFANAASAMAKQSIGAQSSIPEGDAIRALMGEMKRGLR